MTMEDKSVDKNAAANTNASGDINKASKVNDVGVVIESFNNSEASLAGEPFKYCAEDRKGRLTKTEWRDILSLICSGCALMSDGYSNGVMSMVNAVLDRQYPKAYTSKISTQVSNASLVGVIFGQVAIGIATDYCGRKWSIITGTFFVILGCILSAAAHGRSPNGMFWMLTIARGVTGFGIGSEYPASSVAASEAANESVKNRGAAFVFVTNLPLSLGGPVALSIFLILRRITKDYSALWRTSFAIGCFFPLAIFYFRMKLATSELYKESAIKKKVPYWLIIKYYWPRLLGTCGCWFLYDFVCFPGGIFSSVIIGSVLKGANKNLDKLAEWSLLLSAISLPGVFLGGYVCEKIGRKYTLMVGLFGYFVFNLIAGCAYEKISKITALFIVLDGIIGCFSNLGPGNMMGLTSSESFATPVRGTCYGLSAAFGKVGAVVGTELFHPIVKNLGIKYTFIIAACCCVASIILAYFLIPHLREEDLLLEDIKFKNYLVLNGWDGEFGANEDESALKSSSESA